MSANLFLSLFGVLKYQFWGLVSGLSTKFSLVTSIATCGKRLTIRVQAPLKLAIHLQDTQQYGEWQ
jgi:hypothetical protein